MNGKKWIQVILLLSGIFAGAKGQTVLAPDTTANSVANAGVPVVPVLYVPPQNAVNIPARTLLIWNASVGAVTYQIQYATDSLFTEGVITNSTPGTMTQIVVSLSPNTKYYWHVNAKNASGTSAFSAAWNFTTGSKKWFGLFE